MKKGEIYLVNFPFSNLSKTKKRPALLIGEIKGDNKIFCQISTMGKLTKDYKVILNKEDCTEKITFNSFIYCDMIFTLHKDLVFRKLGNIKENKLHEVNNILKNIF